MKFKKGDRVIIKREFKDIPSEFKGTIIKRKFGLLMEVDGGHTWYNVYNNRKIITYDKQWYRNEVLNKILDEI